MNILERIVAERGEDVARAKLSAPPEELAASARGRVHHRLIERLRSGGMTGIIAEMKKASPSAALLRDRYRPAEIAGVYERAGAAGISVLTEPRHFLGSGADLRAARGACDLPILRKDFLCDPYQILEAAAWGADIVLLIVAAVEEDTLRDLYREAQEWGLDVLVEAHTGPELATALSLEAAIVGVNSRDLKTLRTDLAVARELAAMIPHDRVSIAESGIKSREDIEQLEAAGYRGFLIGESLMSAPDPAEKLRDLLG